MKRLSWRWTLAVIQVACAAAALLYAPTQYRAGPHAIGDDSGLVVWHKTWPPPVTRIAYAVNFPALAAVIPVRFAPWWLTTRLSVIREEPLIALAAEDFAFFCAVGVLWYWIGSKIDQFLCRRQVVNMSKPGWLIHSKVLSTAFVAMGFLFALSVGALAMSYTLLTDAYKPFKQIGPFGLIWAVMLLSYCSWSFVKLYRAGTFRIS